MSDLGRSISIIENGSRNGTPILFFFQNFLKQNGPADSHLYSINSVTRIARFAYREHAQQRTTLGHGRRQADWSASAVALSADGKIALTGSDDRTARLWDTAEGTAIGPPLPVLSRLPVTAILI